jgi:hypothetical protein
MIGFGADLYLFESVLGILCYGPCQKLPFLEKSLSRGFSDDVGRDKRSKVTRGEKDL